MQTLGPFQRRLAVASYPIGLWDSTYTTVYFVNVFLATRTSILDLGSWILCKKSFVVRRSSFVVRGRKVL